MNNFYLLPGNHPLLKTVCRAVTADDDIKPALRELEKICIESAGVGLSANQIGSDLRIFVLNLNGIKAFINPEIIDASEQFYFDGEGCLSFPGEVLCTTRYRKITLACDNRPVEILTGVAAVAAQHEFDHLNGITMHDRSIK